MAKDIIKIVESLNLRQIARIVLELAATITELAFPGKYESIVAACNNLSSKLSVVRDKSVPINIGNVGRKALLQAIQNKVVSESEVWDEEASQNVLFVVDELLKIN